MLCSFTGVLDRVVRFDLHFTCGDGSGCARYLCRHRVRTGRKCTVSFCVCQTVSPHTYWLCMGVGSRERVMASNVCS